MKTFSVSEFPERVGDLLREADAGELSLVTKDGEPAFVAVPFNEAMLREGVDVSIAVKLFDEEVVTAAQGARMARMTLAEFMEACSVHGVPVVRYSPAELEMEVANVNRVADR